MKRIFSRVFAFGAIVALLSTTVVFFTPASAAAGTPIVIAVLACPHAPAQPFTCVSDTRGGVLTFVPTDASGFPVTFTTNANGVAKGQIEPGFYTLSESTGSPCFVASVTYDATGKLPVTDRSIILFVYNCGA